MTIMMRIIVILFPDIWNTVGLAKWHDKIPGSKVSSLFKGKNMYCSKPNAFTLKVDVM